MNQVHYSNLVFQLFIKKKKSKKVNKKNNNYFLDNLDVLKINMNNKI